MTQTNVDEMVAKLTGEELREIRRIGFQLADPEFVSFDPEPLQFGPNYIDWDSVESGLCIQG